jgi:hypothetical protein
MYRFLSTASLIIAACVFASCGGSDSGTTPASPKAKYVKQAEAICTKINREAKKAAAAWKKSFAGGVAEAEEHPNDGLRKVLIPALEREAEQLEALEPPTADEAMVTAFVDDLAQASKALKEDGFKALPGSGAIDFKREAAAYGLKSCGRVL